MLHFWTKEQCEQFQIAHFGISCATCERSDEDCPWHRHDEENNCCPSARTRTYSLSCCLNRVDISKRNHGRLSRSGEYVVFSYGREHKVNAFGKLQLSGD